MAKSLLLSTLSSVLGKYVEGLSQENLKLGVWSGKLEFHNLSLKETALDGLNLPVSVRKGFLKTLNVKVPWTSLGSKPVEIVMDGIYLLATPLDLSTLSEADIEKIILARKQELLYATDIMINAAISKFEADMTESSNDLSYLQQMTTRIIDNLEISISNIHIRFEDFLSVPKNPIAFGVTLNKLNLNTTDANGKLTFYKREDKPKSVFKLATLSNVGIYWNNLTPNGEYKQGQAVLPPADSMLPLSQNDFNMKMQELILTSVEDFNALATKLNYILSPINNWSTRITHNATCSNEIPMIDVLLDGEAMSFTISKNQFHELMTFLENLSIIDKKKQSKADTLNKHIDQAVINELGKRYQNLIFNQKILSYTKNTDLSSDELKEIKKIQKDLPLSNLIHFRSNGLNSALKEIKEYIKNSKKKITLKVDPNSQPKKSSWFGGFFSKADSPNASSSSSTSSAKEAEEDEEVMKKIQMELDDINKEALKLAQQVFSFRLKIHAKSNLCLVADGKKIIQSHLHLSAKLENRLNKTDISLKLKDFFIKDEISKKPFYSQIMYVQGITDGSEKVDPCIITHCIEPNLQKFNFDAQPLIIVYNPDCYIALLNFLQSETGLSSTGPAYLYQTAFGFKEEIQLETNDDVSTPKPPVDTKFLLSLNIKAPKIFLPTGDHQDDMTLVIDTGNLIVDGDIQKTSMKWILNLENTSALITSNENLNNLTKYLNSSPPRIIEPLKLQLICNINSESPTKKIVKVNFSISDISLRTSLNSIVHVAKIVERILLITKAQESNSNAIIYKDTSSVQVVEVKQDDAPSPFLISIDTDFAAINIILINDYQGRNNPLLKLDVCQIRFFLGGPLNFLTGQGNLLLSLNYYNLIYRAWEPVMESWEPELSLSFIDSNVDFKVLHKKSNIQFNVTGGMLKCLVNTVDLLQKMNKKIFVKDGSTNDSNSNIITFKNDLDCFIEITSLSNKVREKFSPYQIKKLDFKNFKNENNGKLSHFVNMIIYNNEGTEVISTLYNLPLTNYKMKVYSCVSNDNNGSSEIMIPVIETIFEYSKYNILKRRWTGSSGNMGEPPHYSDILMKKDNDIKNYTLPEGWIWLESEWRPELNGKVGQEIDSDGWEYGSSFSSFSHSSYRRTKIASDTVRRRRMVRTRIYKNPSIENNTISSLSISWDTKANDDESIAVFIRTAKIIENNLPVPIQVGIGFNNGVPSSTFVVNPKDISSLPTIFYGELFVRIRPFLPLEMGSYTNDPSIPWSTELAFASDRHRESYQDVKKINFNKTSMSPSPISFFSYIHRKNNSSCLSFLPEVSFINSLPTSITVSFPSYSSQIIPISSGESYENVSCFDGETFECIIMIDNYKLKETFNIDPKSKKQSATIDLLNLNNGNTLNLSLLFTKQSTGVLEVLLYSRYLFIDYSGLDIVLSDVKSKTTSIFNSNKYEIDDENMDYLSSPANIDKLWKSNKFGLIMFQPVGDFFNFSVNSSHSEKKDININAITYSKSNIEISDGPASTTYFLSLQKHTYLPLPTLTSLIYILPTFLIVNYSSNIISFSQNSNISKDHISKFEPKTVTPWHGGDKSLQQMINIRNNFSDWSPSAINLNTIGTISLLCPSLESQGENLFKVINVDIRFSESTDITSSLIVTIWESESDIKGDVNKKNLTGSIPFAVRNKSHFNFEISQVLEDIKNPIKSTADYSIHNFYLTSKKKSYHPYGWFNPFIKQILNVAIFDIHEPLIKLNVLEINTLRVSRPIITTITDSNGDIYSVKFEVKLNGQGKELLITSTFLENVKKDNSGALSPVEEEIKDNKLSEVNVQLNFKGVCLSIIADSPNRHEFFNLTLDRFFFQCNIHNYESGSFANENFIKIQDILVDNYTMDKYYPLLLSTDDSLLPEKEREKRIITRDSKQIIAPAFSFTFNTRTFTNTINPIIEKLEVLILPIEISIDSSTLLYYFLDLHQEIINSTSTSLDQTENIKMSTLVNYFNENLIQNYSIKYSLNKNIDKIYALSQISKFYFESILIHPIKATLNFNPTPFSRKTELNSDDSIITILSKLESFSPIENFEIKVCSFNTKEVTESWPSLTKIIVTSITTNIQKNILRITGSLFGSMSLLGKPVDLYRNIDSGVSDFFYEPINGFKESPIYFFRGLGKGTQSLISGVTSGFVGSTANIVKSASGGVGSVGRNIVSSLDANDRFVKQQEQNKRKAQTSSGFLSGLQSGAESVGSGFASGIRGLVTNPYEESKKSGAIGFFKGLGKGVVGAAIKPVVGITEGISNVATGISNSVTENKIAKHTRPARAFENIPYNNNINSMLVPFDIYSAQAQDFVIQEAFKAITNDSFITCIKFFESPDDISSDVISNIYPESKPPLNKVPFGMILSKKYLYIVNASIQMLQSYAISTISSIELVLDNFHWSFSLHLYSSKSTNNGTSKLYKFSSQSLAISSYEIIYNFRYMFGNGSSMPTTNDAVNKLNELASKSNVPMNENSRISSSSSKIGSYTFGKANTNKSILSNTPSLSEKQFNLIMANNLLKTCIINPNADRDNQHKMLDENFFRLIHTWVYNHDFLNVSRCCGCLVLNYSNSNITFNQITLNEGRDFIVFNFNFDPEYLSNTSEEATKKTVFCYDQSAKALRPKGAMVIFGFGNRPHLLSLEHVKLKINTSAFDCELSTRSTTNTFIKSSQGFQASYVEKTLSDKFAKYVIIVK